jgi:hypothetical protein
LIPERGLDSYPSGISFAKTGSVIYRLALNSPSIVSEIQRSQNRGVDVIFELPGRSVAGNVVMLPFSLKGVDVTDVGQTVRSLFEDHLRVTHFEVISVSADGYVEASLSD